MDIIELTDEISQLLWRQLLHNVMVNKFNQQLVSVFVGHELGARKLILLLFSLLWLFGLFGLLYFDLGQNLHIFKFLVNHLVHNFLFFFLYHGQNFFTSHLGIISLIVITCFITIGPSIIVVHIKIIKLLDALSGTNLSTFWLIVTITAALLTLATLLTFVLCFVFLTFLITSSCILSIFSGLFFGRKGRF